MGNSKRLPFERYKCIYDREENAPPIWCYQHQGWLVKCEQCGTIVHSARQTTKTCSDKCRKQKSRVARLHNASKISATTDVDAKRGRGSSYVQRVLHDDTHVGKIRLTDNR